MVFVLDEGSTAEVISLTSPIDACRIAAVSSMFKAASESDSVWEKFLPCDYRNIILRSSNLSLLTSASSKKHLYLTLCHYPILVDDGRKSFSLEKSSGKTCYMLSARDLRIVWGDTAQYWNWIPENNSRFKEVAILLDVCWLEICGKISTRVLSPGTLYVAYFVYRLTHARGFNSQAMEAEMGIVGGEMERHKVYLTRTQHVMTRRRLAVCANLAASASASNDSWPKQRNDGWMEVKIGEFHSHQNYEDEVLEMRIMEVKMLHWKSGLMIEGIEIRPKSD